MKKLLLAVILLVACGAAARAEDFCPAINRSDVEQALGAVQLSVSWRSGNDYVCRFTGEGTQFTITIKPYKFQNGWASYAKQCMAPGAPINAIGDEAVACYQGATGQVLGHVRDTLLDVRLTTSSEAKTRDALPKLSAGVAGNLH